MQEGGLNRPAPNDIILWKPLDGRVDYRDLASYCRFNTERNAGRRASS